ncbi:MAG: arsenate reductase ArsC [Pseudomonadota bacterium]
MKKTVLILCTGNSCRSQMAEALVNHDLGDSIRAISAGTRPQPKVADGALAALRMVGIDTAGLYPKSIDAVMNEPVDLVVTVCDNARETCPVFPHPVPAMHMAFRDPHGEPLESFMRVRDEIRARLLPAISQRLAAER